MAVEFCPHCHQPMSNVRLGARLTPLKARIFDLVKRRPGISRKEICWQIYETVTEANIRTVAAHISQINDKLALTDTIIFGLPGNGYHFRKRASYE